MTKEGREKLDLSNSSDSSPALEPGDFVYLDVLWADSPDRGSPFADSAGVLLGSGRYPTIERDLIGSAPTYEETYLVSEENTTGEVAPAPSLEQVFDGRTARLLEQLGITSVVAFLTTDLSVDESLPVDTNRLREMRETLSGTLGDGDVVMVSVETVFRWATDDEAAEAASGYGRGQTGDGIHTASTVSDTKGTNGDGGAGSDDMGDEGDDHLTGAQEVMPTDSSSWPAAWPTPGQNFGRTGAHESGRIDSMTGTVAWTSGKVGGGVADAAAAVIGGGVYLWTDRGITAVDAVSGDPVWEEEYPSLASDGQGWPFTPQPPVGTDGSLYLAPQLTVFDAATGDRERSVGHWSTNARVSIADDILLIAEEDTLLRVDPLDGDDSDDVFVIDAEDGTEDPTVPAYSADHEIALATDREGALVGVNTAAGTVEWRAVRAGAFRAPSVGTYAVAVTDEQILEGVNVNTGEEAWRTDVTHTPISDPAATGQRVYVTGPEALYGIDDDSGEIVFEYAFDEADVPATADSETVPPRPTILPDLYHHRVFAAAGNALYAVDPRTGECKWSCVFDAEVTTQPVFANGYVYLRTADGRAHAVE